MKTKTLAFSAKEISLLRKVLSNRVTDLRIDGMLSVRCGLSAKSVYKELSTIDLILSKLNNI